MGSPSEDVGLSGGIVSPFPCTVTSGNSQNILAKPGPEEVEMSDTILPELEIPNVPHMSTAASRDNKAVETYSDDMVAYLKENISKLETTTEITETFKPTSPFQFMKLPPELRMMVYKYHFLQVPDHLGRHCWDTEKCSAGQTPCRNSQVNSGIPLQGIWTVSKTVYHEAMPIFFAIQSFYFENVERLGKFLATIGPYHRQHITTVRFTHLKVMGTIAFEVKEAFRLLGECPNLVNLSIQFLGDNATKKSVPSLNDLAKIRGIHKLEISFFDPYWMVRIDDSELQAGKKKIADKVEALTEPYTPAAMKRREAKGISKFAEPREIFTMLPEESRAARLARREQYREIA
ncbi:MAG: hypothetical protein Q9170_008323 [Blastenia crenularia]